MTQNALKTFRSVRLALIAGLGFSLTLASNAFAQLPAPAVPAEPGAPPPSTAEVERVVVTGSNIPTAEETGPNPVDTYRPQDIEKLGIRNATDLQEFIPQQAGGTVNLNIGNGGDGTIQFNLRGLLPKETLVLIDGKRVAYGSLASAGFSGGPDINLIPFSMVDHVDILKDGASAVYGSDAIAGVVNFFLVHKFRGLEIGGTYGNTNLGASNEMGEWNAWIKAGTGDDKTDIVVIADFWERLGGVFSRDRDISSNGFFVPFGGFDARSGNEPGRVQSRRLLPRMFFAPIGPTQFGVNSPLPHSAPNAANSPFYKNPFAVNPNAYPGSPGILNPNGFNAPGFTQTGPKYRGGGDYFFYNFAAVTPALPPGDRQVYYGSFTRDLCDKYLTVFGDFKYARSYFNSSLAAAPFTPDPFHNGNTGTFFSPSGISVPISNPFNPFTIADATIPNFFPDGSGLPVTTGVRFRSVQDTGQRSEKFTYWDQLFDVGLRGEMGWIADYFKTWNWEAGFRYSRNEGQDLSVGEVSQPGLRQALLDTDPATAFNPFMGLNGVNTGAARGQVYVTLHNSGEYELPIYYATFNGDLFNLPAGPVSFAIGGEYDAPRFTRDRDALNQTFNTIGSTDGQSYKVNRDIWGIYEEVRVPFTSPTWNFPGFYSFEVDFAEREEWYSTNTSAVLPSGLFPKVDAFHSTYDAQKPKVSIRWQPMDPKYIGALTLRGSYTEAFHAPTLSEVTPASSQNFPVVADPFSTQTEPQIEERVLGNPAIHPEVAYEWTYGAVYSPKWVKGLTLSADWWHIDMRDIVATLGAQTIILENPPPNNGASSVFGPGGTAVFRSAGNNPNEPGPVDLVIDPNNNLSGAVFEGLDYEAIYILDSSIFGHGDFGRFTTTVNGTWLSRAEFQAAPGVKRVGIAGEFLPPAFALTSSLPWHRANFSLFYDGPADTWMQGLDVGAIVHWTGQYEDDNASLTGSTKLNMPRSGPLGGTSLNPPNGNEIRARKVSALTTLDLLFNYTFNLPPPAPAEVPGFAKDGGKNVRTHDGKEKNVVPVSTAEYGCSNWKWWLNNTTVTLGMQNVTDEDPPFVAGSFENGYDESLTTIKGRFWYVGLKKRF
ncbi:MAG TPA: TonB-dependent receptor plug domain-containing protein [Candidatus Udaeobacter sp.]|jgi:outer membrane receptor protein involved in Fe transport|nr:TonB-dependent receptor plug domain-containing protein [Candidatus Udaeobacter sp.]